MEAHEVRMKYPHKRPKEGACCRKGGKKKATSIGSPFSSTLQNESSNPSKFTSYYSFLGSDFGETIGKIKKWEEFMKHTLYLLVKGPIMPFTYSYHFHSG